ncbi:Acyl-phosphate:glycerol-3-phosphate O-acyltransferase PlsY (EC 2.3.1.n3) [hydrothermal vent metagenome]|uniref:Acyl-phosphate:glycerol-3-phosphate O-acyltransferase PlsY n=1 Tax=hydrothermal vent metagenome TaxID=652676 RepID=A0A3B1D5Y3_9ZZZZ
MSSLAAALVASYLAGSIPTALIAGRIVGKIDIREAGSGNAGATNVYRLFGLKPYLVTLGVDIFKGYAAVVFIAPYGAGIVTEGRTALLCGVLAILGHIWTVFARFKGGKGVATGGGVMLGLAPWAALAAVGVYLAVTFTTKYVSLGSMLAALSLPIFILLIEPGAGRLVLIIAFGLAALIIYTHRSNIRKLVRGEEGKTDFFARHGDIK